MANEPFIRNLEVKIQQASSELIQAEYQAEMACYWARSGNFIKAEDICRELRSRYGSGHYPRISVLIMCIEGLLLFFRDVREDSLDRLNRALLLSNALGIKDIAAFSSAWTAHINFNFDRYPAMCESLQQCIDNLDQRNIAARGRLAIVLSDAFMLCGNLQASKRWFAIARAAASDMGDHTLVASLTYNRAAINAYSTQIQILRGRASPDSLGLVASEIGSAIGYQRLVDLRSLEQLLHLVRIGINVFQGNFEAGWSEAKKVEETYDRVLLPTQSALLTAQMSLCAMMTNRKDQVHSSILAGQGVEAMELCDPGDRALIAECCSRVAATSGNEGLAEKYRLQVEENLDAFSRSMESLQSMLRTFQDIEV